MTFEVRDLMIDVVPEGFAPAHQLNLCQPDTAAPQPPPPQPPPPPPQPLCQPITMNGPVQQAGGLPPEISGLAPLAALREQLHQALHS